MDSKTITVGSDTITVELGDTFEVHSTLNFGSGQLHSGDILTLTNISEDVGRVEFEFTVSESSETYVMYEYALEKNFENNYLSFL